MPFLVLSLSCTVYMNHHVHSTLQITKRKRAEKKERPHAKTKYDLQQPQWLRKIHVHLHVHYCFLTCTCTCTLLLPSLTTNAKHPDTYAQFLYHQFSPSFSLLLSLSSSFLQVCVDTTGFCPFFRFCCSKPNQYG